MAQRRGGDEDPGATRPEVAPERPPAQPLQRQRDPRGGRGRPARAGREHRGDALSCGQAQGPGPPLPPRRGQEPRARRRARGALRRRRASGARLREAAGEDGGAFSPGPFHSGRRGQGVPHRRQGATTPRREPRDPRARGLHGQDPGLQHRARRRGGRHPGAPSGRELRRGRRGRGGGG